MIKFTDSFHLSALPLTHSFSGFLLLSGGSSFTFFDKPWAITNSFNFHTRIFEYFWQHFFIGQGASFRFSAWVQCGLAGVDGFIRVTKIAAVLTMASSWARGVNLMHIVVGYSHISYMWMEISWLLLPTNYHKLLILMETLHPFFWVFMTVFGSDWPKLVICHLIQFIYSWPYYEMCPNITNNFDVNYSALRVLIIQQQNTIFFIHQYCTYSL